MSAVAYIARAASTVLGGATLITLGCAVVARGLHLI
jgi:hypothetical protein